MCMNKYREEANGEYRIYFVRATSKCKIFTIALFPSPLVLPEI